MRRLVFAALSLRCKQGLNLINPLGRRVTGDLDREFVQRSPASPPPYYSQRSYPHQVNFGDDDFPPSPFTGRLPLTPARNDRGSPPRTDEPLSPAVEVLTHPPTPRPLPPDSEYIMEVHIVTKTKAKRGKAGEVSTLKKSPVRLPVSLTYQEFLKRVAKAADVSQAQLDCEHMRWRFRKPACASSTNVSADESYKIMLEAIRPKKGVDRWIFVEMGKPLLSKAMSPDFFPCIPRSSG